MHVSLADIARTIGRNPTFPFELDRAAARGFSRDDWRELGHWAGEAEMESDDEDAPVGVPAPRGRGMREEGNWRASRRGAMDLVYSRGEGRMGEEARQLAVRGRLIRIIRVGRTWPPPQLSLGGRAWVCVFGSMRCAAGFMHMHVAGAMGEGTGLARSPLWMEQADRGMSRESLSDRGCCGVSRRGGREPAPRRGFFGGDSAGLHESTTRASP
jgi:hypothetical protein